ncbi:hypothetical protein [Novosphingobium jiangmenense]|uniref:Lipoprotein n=1 Tax=Novosphingobium jiangmenense TaxID=2791981 RepID=A0ABS0HKE8_9SPHN|nr:hypothetical protein [Novosphingobium jiangmenense]MBF9152731.1 hypothetical protein [Novosphingobium jiangmenense]
MKRARLILGVALAGLLAGCAAEPDEYPLSRKQAYDKLLSARIESSGDGPFFRLRTTITGNGGSEVTYDALGDMAHRICHMHLTELEPERTKVKVTCEGGGAGEGAAAGMAHNMIRNRVIELVDATLKDRPFDPELAGGATAYRWPGDGVDGSFAGAAGKALKQDAEMHRDMAEAEQAARESQAEAPGEYVDSGAGLDPAPEQ